MKPDATGDDFEAIKDTKTVSYHQKLEKLSQKISIRSLQRVYEPLSLDKFRCCETCAKASDNSLPVAD